MCESNASGVMTSSAGLSFSATLSSAKRESVIPKRKTEEMRSIFITEISRDSSTPIGMTRLWWQAPRLQLSDAAAGDGCLHRRTYCDSFDGPAGDWVNRPYLLSPPFTPIFFRN